MEINKCKGCEEVQSTNGKSSQEEKDNLYFSSTSTQSNKNSQLINSSVSYHMKPHIESLCEYDNFYGGVVLLGDDSLNTIVG